MYSIVLTDRRDKMNNLEVKDIMKSYRVRIGKSQTDMAELLGVTRLTFKTYEESPGSIPIRKYGRLVELYGEDFNEYFFANKLYKVYRQERGT